MKKIVVVGAGKIGSTIAEMLADTGDYDVTVVDRSPTQLAAAELPPAVDTRGARHRRSRRAATRCWPASSPCSAPRPIHLTTAHRRGRGRTPACTTST